MEVVIVGAGLAGCEAAWQLAERGVAVRLYERRPTHASPAHMTPDFAELVCSNSFRAAGTGNAVGLLKEEMRRLGSLVLRIADETAVPAGRALAVDRLSFSKRVTEAIETHPSIQVVREQVDRIPDEPIVVLASGPLTSEALAADLQARIGETSLYFYDAISPIVYADSVDPEVAFRASRYEDGEGDYLNLPLSEADYASFVTGLLEAETVPLHAFEAKMYFEGCLPIEEMARRGPETLRYGPMKPVGLRDPHSGERPHAVVQLRHEDKSGVLYNLVGFQTKLRVRGQQEVFRALPGMQEAVFARYGSVHRNTYVNAPSCLSETLELKGRPGCYLAGQMAGVEGYVESAALGFVVGVNAAYATRGEVAPLAPEQTAHGALCAHLRGARAKDFQPMNVNYGLFPTLMERLKKRERNEKLAARALEALAPWAAAIGARPNPECA